MALTLAQLAAMSEEELKRQYSGKRCCSECDGPLYEPHAFETGLVCADCYFEALGRLVEETPIGGGVRR